MITFGADPEVFIISRKDGEMIPAGVVLRHDIETQHGYLHIDGAALEFQPNFGRNESDLCYNLRQVIHEAASIFSDSNYVLVAKPDVKINLDKWVNGMRPELTIFGCDPDASIYGSEFSPRNINAAKHGYRYGGGHLHFGLPPNFNLGSIVGALDQTVGIVASAVFGITRRTKVYGRPGIYRIQPHGLEYRTPSNQIIRDPDTFTTFLKIARWAIENQEEALNLLPQTESRDYILNGTPMSCAIDVCKIVGVSIPEPGADYLFVKRWTL